MRSAVAARCWRMMDSLLRPHCRLQRSTALCPARPSSQRQSRSLHLLSSSSPARTAAERLPPLSSCCAVRDHPITSDRSLRIAPPSPFLEPSLRSLVAATLITVSVLSTRVAALLASAPVAAALRAALAPPCFFLPPPPPPLSLSPSVFLRLSTRPCGSSSLVTASFPVPSPPCRTPTSSNTSSSVTQVGSSPARLLQQQRRAVHAPRH